MDPAFINVLVNLGGYGIMVWLVMDMRKEASTQRDQIWNMVLFLIKERHPDADVDAIVSGQGLNKQPNS